MKTPHNTIRNYTSALLDTFNEVQCKGEYVPLRFSVYEKSELQERSQDPETQVLPSGFLRFSGLTQDSERQQNRTNKINIKKEDKTALFIYNSQPYEFAYELVYLARGMAQASEIIEFIAPRFNPQVALDIQDHLGVETTRCILTLNSVNIETQELTAESRNLVTLTFDLTLKGHLYMPLTAGELVKQVKINKGMYEFDE